MTRISSCDFVGDWSDVCVKNVVLTLHELQYLGHGECIYFWLRWIFSFYEFQNMTGIEGKFTKFILANRYERNQAEGISHLHVFLTLNPFSFLFSLGESDDARR